MSNKLNSGVRYAYIRGGAAWRMLRGYGIYGVEIKHQNLKTTVNNLLNFQ